MHTQKDRKEGRKAGLLRPNSILNYTMCNCLSEANVVIYLFCKTTCLTTCPYKCEMCTIHRICTGIECIILIKCRFVLACPTHCLKCTEKTDGSGTECIAHQCESRYTIQAADQTCRGQSVHFFEYSNIIALILWHNIFIVLGIIVQLQNATSTHCKRHIGVGCRQVFARIW